MRDSLRLEKAWVLGVYPTCETCIALKALQSQRQRHETAPAARFAEWGLCPDRAQLTMSSVLVLVRRPQSLLLDSVVLVLCSSFPQCPQHGEHFALGGEASMDGIMGSFQRVVVSALEGIVTAHAERSNHRLA